MNQQELPNQIGRYTIQSKPNDTYDLYDLETSQFIVNDLYLWSAAYAIARALHEGRFEDANAVAFLEAKYVKHLQSMLVFEHTKKYDRYLDEKIEAESLRKKIYSFCEK